MRVSDPPTQSHERYERIFAEVEAPFAFVDLDAMWANAEAMLERAGGKPIRVATKSIRCRALLEEILRRDQGFAGLMTYTLPETLWLAEQGFENLLLAYPTADVGALGELALRSVAEPGRGAAGDGRLRRAPGRDRVGARRRRRRRSGSASTSTPAGGRWAGGSRSGRSARRSTPSSRRWRWRARSRSRPQIELDALMAYEGQIAGVGDRPPGQRLRGAAIRFMQRRSAAELAERRAAIVAAIGEFCELEIVNGGGTGSLELTAAEAAVTEVTAGSGFYAPALFDHYSRFSLTPAAGFALPIVRKPAAEVATALGGGYLASGSGDAARLPAPWLPAGLELDPEEGAGEVQTPLLGDAAAGPRNRRPRLPAPRQGRRALRALQRPPPRRRRRDRRRRPHLPRRGQGVSLVRGRWADLRLYAEIGSPGALSTS